MRDQLGEEYDFIHSQKHYFLPHALDISQTPETFIRSPDKNQEALKHIWSEKVRNQKRENVMELLELVNRVYETRNDKFHRSAESIEMEAIVATAGKIDENSYTVTENCAAFDTSMHDDTENESSDFSDFNYKTASFVVMLSEEKDSPFRIGSGLSIKKTRSDVTIWLGLHWYQAKESIYGSVYNTTLISGLRKKKRRGLDMF